MTIVLGFAWWTLPDGQEVGVVDVPGHRDFIENMLAGVGGIDAVLFVVAADEGVMPQTREHLAILDILQIQAGVVALTKIDMVDDPEWFDLVEEDLHQLFIGSVLQDAEIVRVSAKTGVGLGELEHALSRCLSAQPPRPDFNRPRLPVDRVFTIAGFGTVVTGTLTDGSIKTGDDVEILPGGVRGRIRGLQTHKRKAEVAFPGSRTAVNISGVNVDQIRRGQVITRPQIFSSTRRMDVHFRLLPDVTQALKHNTQVKFFIGSAENIARVRLLGTEELAPGDDGWLQLELREPVVAVRGDRYILRRPSPSETLGGGEVIDPFPKGRHKRFSESVLQRLEALAEGTPSDVLMQALLPLGVAQLKDVIQGSNLQRETAHEAVEELLSEGRIITMQGEPSDVRSLVTSLEYWNDLKTRVDREILQ
jgi:selenocysteine-specific elongation factor